MSAERCDIFFFLWSSHQLRQYNSNKDDINDWKPEVTIVYFFNACMAALLILHKPVTEV